VEKEEVHHNHHHHHQHNQEHQVHVIVEQLQLVFVEIIQQMLLLHAEEIKLQHVNKDVHQDLHHHKLHLHQQHVIAKDKQEHNVEQHLHM
jgi:hypothetical protein